MRRSATVAAAAILVLLWAVAGCGGGSAGGGGGGDAGKPVTLEVQDTAGAPSAFLQYGVSKGFFKKQKLNVKVTPTQGGAAVVPAVLSGQIAIGGSNVPTVLLAAAKGLPVRIIAPGTFVQNDRKHDFAAILVSRKSDIRSPKDLEGKTLAVNTLKNIAEVGAKASLQKKGVDVSKIKLLEVDFPEMIAALEKGRVDAAVEIEPFVSQALASGDRVVDRPYVGTKPGLQIGCYFTSAKYLSKNADVVKRFHAAVADTAQAVSEDPDAFRAFLPKASEIPPAAVGRPYEKEAPA